MPIKIFAAPGDHRDDFKKVEQQVNEWETASRARIVGMELAVNPMPEKRDAGHYLMTLAVRYEPA
ncbi:MAG: hypothetical protein HY763_10430 [Planctomycetes bacterium]|nr:hypothetical protein [Planctomycetota bacterium]